MKTRILVIDDDLIIRRLFTLYLQKRGFLITSVASVEEGLEVLRDSPIDVITCDVMMPGKNGYDFLKIVNSDPRLCQIPVIILSATGLQNEAILLEEFKATKVVSKPCMPQELEAVILELTKDK
ncbi:MAG: response regulator [Anaerolineaceae bacterium]|nr:response regulator [Anaerolineaceae bacterium]